MICVSKCLLGEKCRYDGKNAKNEKIIAYLKDKSYVGVCPESLGGLSIPREPSEINDDHFYTKSGKNVDEAFITGAHKALQIALENGCSEAILKEFSPSCGVNTIYDGTFSGKKINGQGIYTKLLIENGIHVISSEEFE